MGLGAVLRRFEKRRPLAIIPAADSFFYLQIENDSERGIGFDEYPQRHWTNFILWDVRTIPDKYFPLVFAPPRCLRYPLAPQCCEIGNCE